MLNCENVHLSMSILLFFKKRLILDWVREIWTIFGNTNVPNVFSAGAAEASYYLLKQNKSYKQF